MSCVVQGALEERAAREKEESDKNEIRAEVTEKIFSAYAEIDETINITTKTDSISVTSIGKVTDKPVVTTNLTATIKNTTVPAGSTAPKEQTSQSASVAETEPVTAEKTEQVTEPPVRQEPPATEKPPAPAPAPSGNSVPESTRADDSYLEKCAFIGDSHIKGMSGYGIVSDNRVFAHNGLSLAHLSEKVKASDVQSINPENIYIMMGTNGIMWTDWDVMIQQYRDFTNTLVQAMPDARIYILSIPPVNAQRENKEDVASGKYLNSDIDGYNSKLLEMAKENGWYYVDVNSTLKDENGYLISSTDGIHMSKDLYSTFKNYILTHVAS